MLSMMMRTTNDLGHTFCDGIWYPNNNLPPIQTLLDHLIYSFANPNTMPPEMLQQLNNTIKDALYLATHQNSNAAYCIQLLFRCMLYIFEQYPTVMFSTECIQLIRTLFNTGLLSPATQASEATDLLSGYVNADLKTSLQLVWFSHNPYATNQTSNFAIFSLCQKLRSQEAINDYYARLVKHADFPLADGWRQLQYAFSAHDSNSAAIITEIISGAIDTAQTSMLNRVIENAIDLFQVSILNRAIESEIDIAQTSRDITAILNEIIDSVAGTDQKSKDSIAIVNIKQPQQHKLKQQYIRAAVQSIVKDIICAALSNATPKLTRSHAREAHNDMHNAFNHWKAHINVLRKDRADCASHESTPQQRPNHTPFPLSPSCKEKNRTPVPAFNTKPRRQKPLPHCMFSRKGQPGVRTSAAKPANPDHKKSPDYKKNPDHKKKIIYKKIFDWHSACRTTKLWLGSIIIGISCHASHNKSLAEFSIQTLFTSLLTLCAGLLVMRIKGTPYTVAAHSLPRPNTSKT